MTAYAYTNQKLEDHSVNTCKVALEYSAHNYAKVCARRIRSASGKNLSSDDFIDLVKISALFHDSGKAADSYQKQFEGPPPERPAFYLHEIPSAIMAKAVMEGVDYDREWIYLVSLAILFHHTAMRPFGIQEGILRSRSVFWTFSKYRPVLDELSGTFLKGGLRISKIGIEEARSFMEWVERIAQDKEKSRFAKLYCLILNPLIYGDNIDAKSRGGDKVKSRFIKELEETIDGSGYTENS